MTPTDPGGASRPVNGHGCTVRDCTGPHHGRGFCAVHHRRWLRHGDPCAEVAVTRRSGQAPSYRSARRQVSAVRGPATDQWCTDCAAVAVVWSYDGTDPDERREPGRGRRFSLDPARYRSRCRACHRRTLAPETRSAAVLGLDVERAARLYRGGATARGIGSVLGTGPDAVLRALRAHGVAIRPGGRPGT